MTTIVEQDREIERMVPDQLVSGFTETPLMKFLVVALIAHVVLVSVASVGYVYDTWIDPEGAAERQAAAKAKLNPKPDTTTNPAAAAPGPGDQPASATTQAQSTGTTTEPGDGSSDTLTVNGREVPNTETMRELTDVADKKDIPKEPDLGINLDETDPFAN